MNLHEGWDRLGGVRVIGALSCERDGRPPLCPSVSMAWCPWGGTMAPWAPSFITVGGFGLYTLWSSTPLTAGVAFSALPRARPPLSPSSFEDGSDLRDGLGQDRSFVVFFDYFPPLPNTCFWDLRWLRCSDSACSGVPPPLLRRFE